MTKTKPSKERVRHLGFNYLLKECKKTRLPTRQDHVDLFETWFDSQAIEVKHLLNDYIADRIQKAHSLGRKEERKKVRTNIGYLRQWLNETKKIVTSYDIETWLFDKKFADSIIKTEKEIK